MNLTAKHYAIIFFTLITASLHLFLLTRLGPDPIALNGLGYLVLLGAYFLPIPFFRDRHFLVWWAITGYSMFTIILWVVLREPKPFVFDFSTPSIGYYAKTAELLQIIFLFSDKPK